MATHTLTKASPTQVFNHASDGDLQVIISQDSTFAGATFSLEYETATATVYIPIPATSTDKPSSNLYTFKAGNIKLKVSNASDNTSVVADIR